MSFACHAAGKARLPVFVGKYNSTDPYPSVCSFRITLFGGDLGHTMVREFCVDTVRMRLCLNMYVITF